MVEDRKGTREMERGDRETEAERGTEGNNRRGEREGGREKQAFCSPAAALAAGSIPPTYPRLFYDPVS